MARDGMGLLCVVLVLASCTSELGSTSSAGPSTFTSSPPITHTPTPAQSPGTTTAATPSADRLDGGVPLGGPPCAVGLPAAWKSALARGVDWRGKWDTQLTGPPTPDGTAVLHESDNGATARLALVGAGQQIVEDIGTIAHPRGAQFTYSAISDRYVAFVYALTNGDDAQSRWKLYLFDRARHILDVVAKNPVDGHGRPLAGGWVEPALTGTYLYWIEAHHDARFTPGDRIRQLALATGKARTLYEGQATALVPYRSILLYAAASRPNGAAAVFAVDQHSGYRATPPAGITAAADGAFTIVADAGTLVWNTEDGSLRGWRADWHRSITLVPSSAQWPLAQRLHIAGGPAYPRVYGHFLIWQPGRTVVLDLRRNTFAALTRTPGGEDLSGAMLSLDSYTSATSYDRGTGRIQNDQRVINLHDLPDLPSCRQ